MLEPEIIHRILTIAYNGNLNTFSGSGRRRWIKKKKKKKKSPKPTKSSSKSVLSNIYT